MAAVAAAPKLVEEVAELIISDKQEWWGAEIGIETGSPELAKKVMPLKFALSSLNSGLKLSKPPLA